MRRSVAAPTLPRHTPAFAHLELCALSLQHSCRALEPLPLPVHPLLHPSQPRLPTPQLLPARRSPRLGPLRLLPPPPQRRPLLLCSRLPLLGARLLSPHQRLDFLTQLVALPLQLGARHRRLMFKRLALCCQLGGCILKLTLLLATLAAAGEASGAEEGGTAG